MNANDRTATLTNTLIDMIDYAGGADFGDCQLDQLPRIPYSFYAPGVIDLDAAALRDVYRALLARYGRPDPCALRAMYNRQANARAHTLTRTGNRGPVQHLNALAWTLMLDSAESVADDMDHDGGMRARAAYWEC